MTISAFFSLASHRETWRLVWPIILSNSSVPLLGAVDTAVVGHLPDPHYIGSVAIGALIFSFLYWGFGFLRMGTTGFVAQASGEEDATEVRSVLARALILSGLLRPLYWPLQVLVLWLALLLIDGSAQVEGGAADYFYVRVWGAPAVLANYALMGFFIGIRNTKAALTVQIFMNSLNIILDLIFVIGFGWDVVGVAAATAISESLALILGLYIVRRELLVIGGVWKRSAILSLASMTRPACGQFRYFHSHHSVDFLLCLFHGAGREGRDVTLAAVAVLINFIHFMAFGLDGFAFAAEGMIGTAIGAKRPDKLREIVYVTGFWALVVACLYALVYLVFGSAIIDLLTGIEDVRARAKEFLPWLILMPLVAIWSYQIDGIFIGAVQSKEMRNGMIISFIAYMTAMHFFGDFWGADGYWAALVVFFAARAVTLAAVYPRVERRARA